MANTRQRDVSARVATSLRLAAAPCFALMALLAALRPAAPLEALCGGGQASALGGMAAMYLLMGVFHLPPWLARIRPASRAGTAHEAPRAESA